ncbi:MAG: FG-GAP repeat domain-containing protein, partial [Candidatus Methylomirabilales bacterium]
NDLTILKGDGTGQFTRLPDVKVPDDPIVLGAGDFNEDGKPDLVLVFASLHKVGIYLGDGRGGFSPAVSSTSPSAR